MTPSSSISINIVRLHLFTRLSEQNHDHLRVKHVPSGLRSETIMATRATYGDFCEPLYAVLTENDQRHAIFVVS